MNFLIYCLFSGLILGALYFKIDFRTLFFSLTGIGLCADAVLYGFLKRCNYDREKFRGPMICVFGGGFLLIFSVSGLVYYGSNHALSFECSKKTMTCVCSRTAPWRSQLHTAGVYDFSNVTHTRVETAFWQRNSRYSVVWQRADGSSFKLPVSFSSGTAKQEAEKIDAFLTGPQEKYRFYRISLNNGSNPVIHYGSAIFSLIVSLAGFAVLWEAYTESRPKRPDPATAEFKSENDK